MSEFLITGEYIELHRLLKAAKLCGTGGEAKLVIDEGIVAVDGEIDTRLRRKVRDGMTVKFNGKEITVRAGE